MSAAGLNRANRQRRHAASAGAAILVLLLTGLSACSSGSDETASATTTSAPTTGPASAPPTGGPTTDAASALASARSTAAESTAPARPVADTVLKISVRGRDVTPAPGRQTVSAGDRVQLTITTDTANEVHIHGVEIEKATKPGVPLTVEFVVQDPGIYAVELHKPELLLLQLVVR
jgi:plastocyanin